MIIQGDCVEKMRELDEASVDAIVCDPPYGLEFMGKEWDRIDGNRGRHTGTERKLIGENAGAGAGFDKRMAAAPNFGSQEKNPKCAKCDRYKWDHEGRKCDCALPDFRRRGMGAEQEAWHLAWAVEAYRVLKPGGHLLAFGGTRTYHRLACAVEDAGFEIRDSLIWLYGSGFPKSLDVSKAIDKAAGAERERVGSWKPTGTARLVGGQNPDGIFTDYEGAELKGELPITAPATPEAAQWEGWGTALKPSHEPIVVARKPLSGTVAANVLKHSTGALNIDGTRIGTDATERKRTDDDFGLVNDDGWEPTPGVNGSPAGRWPSNVVLSHLPECEQVGVRKVKSGDQAGGGRRPGGFGDVGAESGDSVPNAPGYGTETIPAYECAENCPVSALDAQSGAVGGSWGQASRGSRPENGWGMGEQQIDPSYHDTGGASRFFLTTQRHTMEECVGVSSAETSLSQSSQPDASAQNDVATEGRREDSTSTDPNRSPEPSTSATPSGSSARSASDTPAIPNTEPEFSQGSKQPKPSRTSNPASPAGRNEPTDTTTTTPSLLKSDGSAEAATSSDMQPNVAPGVLDSGEPRFRYTAKASRAERNAGLTGANGEVHRYGAGIGEGHHPEAPSVERNVHPTVKPIDLMRWLVRLVTPPGGTICDPFVGSGTTGVAAALEGFDFIGIEREAEYVAIAEARIAWWSAFPGEDTAEVLIRAGLSERLEREHRESGQLGLLE